eukprot:SAG31_NODE_285_length_18479_cov_9.871980_19_plen_266_part_00
MVGAMNLKQSARCESCPRILNDMSVLSDRLVMVDDFSELLSAAGCSADKLVALPRPLCFWGVYDGHAGHDTSEFAAEQLHKDVATCLVEAANSSDTEQHGGAGWSDTSIATATTAAYNKTDRVFLDWARKRRRKDGTTAVTVLLIGNRLHVGWVGDSRAVLVDTDGCASWATGVRSKVCLRHDQYLRDTCPLQRITNRIELTRKRESKRLGELCCARTSAGACRLQQAWITWSDGAPMVLACKVLWRMYRSLSYKIGFAQSQGKG